MEQLSLHFSHPTSFNTADFILTESNKTAFDWINSWPNWENGIYSRISCILGEKASGKTYLAHIWQTISKAEFVDQSMLQDRTYFTSQTNSYVLEDIEIYADSKQLLFDFINYIITSNKFLLITTSNKLIKIDFKLPDLQSRLNSIFTVEVYTPNEETIAQVLVKQFSDRQIVVDGTVISYLINRIDRSYTAISAIVDKLDKFSLAHKRKISIPLVKEVCNL